MSPGEPIIRSRHIMVDGIRTHYLEAGEGEPIVLLHSGEYGACAALSWEYNIPALATRYRVIAPDWLGFGETDKLYDFAGGVERRLQHMGRFLKTVALDRAAFFGSSMGGSVLLAAAAARRADFPLAALVISSGGGFVPDNDARRSTLNYTGTLEEMRAIVAVITHDPKWAANEYYVARRHALSIKAGAWEAISAARFRAPWVRPKERFGQADQTPYENISVPTLLVAGANDRLREPGYADVIAQRIPDATVLCFDDCGHLPHIEHAEAFNAAALEFLGRVYPP